MKIGIDARLLERRMTGIGRYLSNIVRYIPVCDPKNQYVLFSYRPLPGFPKDNIVNIPTMDSAPEGRLQKIASAFWLYTILPRFIRKEKIDIFFSPTALLPLRDTGAKNVITIHDVFQLVDPRFHPPLYRAYVSFIMSRTLKKADHILTISEASKRDIVRLLHAPEEKVTVVYEAADERFAPRAISSADRAHYAKKYGLAEHFILYLGVIEKRKNIEGIIKIADGLRDKTDVQVVLIGREGYGGKQYIEEIRRHGNMRYLGFVDEADIPYFYNLAEVFLFPSYYEGFGLPPLEAMQSGLPVVASNTSSLPEVIGDAGILLPPEDDQKFVDAVLRILGDPEEKAALVKKGLAQAKKFSFENTARATLAVLLGL